MIEILEKLSDKLIRAKKCWLWHDWTRWIKTDVTIVGGEKEYQVTHQERHCLRCGIEEWRRP